MKKIYSILLLFILLTATTNAQHPTEGMWRGVIHYSNAEVPFLFDVAYEGNSKTPTITIINGDDEADIDRATVKGDSIHIPMFAFDTIIKAKFTENSMKGRWYKNHSNRDYRFEATYDAPRYNSTGLKTPTQIENRWQMTFRPGTERAYPVLGIFEQSGHIITGTMLTETSDYRFFEGVIDGNTLKASSFDGTHAFAMEGTFENGTWKGKMIYSSGSSEDWKAVYDEHAEIRDPFGVISLGKTEHKPDFESLPAEGQPAINTEKYDGKVLMIQLFGTWCPNSYDQTNYLVDWYKNHRKDDVEILAVSFEANYSVEYGEKRIAEYKQNMNIDYDVILGGRLNKGVAASAFPFMDRIMAFPTLVIVDKKGYARYVHSFFTGPATGEYYTRFDERLNQILDELLAE